MRHHKEVQKIINKLIFILIQSFEVHRAGRVKVNNHILPEKQYEDKNHDFHRDAKFTLIKQVSN